MKFIISILTIITLYSGCYFMQSSSGGGETRWESPRNINPADIALPDGYAVEAAAEGFTFPTSITFDDNGNYYVTEAGYSYGEVFTTPKLIKIDKNGSRSVLAEGENNGPWTSAYYHQNNIYVAEGGQLEGGRILRISLSGNVTVLLDSLPGMGDHHTNGAVVRDGYIYFGQGTATNSAVVGKDNYDFGWLKRYPDFHDIPCDDITLNGENFESPNPLNADKENSITGAYVPFNTATKKGDLIKGKIPCSGAVMRIPVEGGNIELVAWGFRNPFGLAFSSEGDLYVTDNGYDDRGSRPVWGTGDLLWKVENGKWYGWPDYSGGHELHDTRKILAEDPNEPPKPQAVLAVHSSSNGLDFSRSNEFGYTGEAFIAQFGDQAPGVGKVLNPVGFKIVRVNTQSGLITDFAVNKGDVNGPASYLNSGGFERPVAVRFSPDGRELYVVDFGVMLMGEQGPRPQKETGVVWVIRRQQ